MLIEEYIYLTLHYSKFALSLHIKVLWNYVHSANEVNLKYILIKYSCIIFHLFWVYNCRKHSNVTSNVTPGDVNRLNIK